MLMNVIIISVLLHIAAGFIAGIVTIATHAIQEEAQFEEPPVVEQEEPPPDVKVEIKPTPPKTPPLENLKMKQVDNIAVADVAVDLPNMGDSFTVSAGLGSMSGSLLGGGGGGLGLKMPEIDFFGAKSKGEKICFVVHFGPATTTQKGESTPYTRMTAYTIRKRLEELVSGLPSQAMFNVTAFWAGHCNPFAERMLQATSAHKDLLRQWMAPVNPVESSTETYGSSFGKFGGLLAKTPWPQKIDKNIPSFGPAWYYNYVSPRSDEVKYFGEPVPKTLQSTGLAACFGRWSLSAPIPSMC